VTAALLAAYHATTYRIEDVDTGIDLRIDTRSEGLEALLQRRGVDSAAIVTAWNPGSVPTEAAINDAANRRLRTEIQRRGRAGLDSLAIPDTVSWPPEPGFLILGVDGGEARTLAVEYGQNAFVYVVIGAPARLVTTALMKGIERSVPSLVAEPRGIRRTLA
jgi:hypothetical protein